MKFFLFCSIQNVTKTFEWLYNLVLSQSLCFFRRVPQSGNAKSDGEHVYAIILMGSAQGCSSLHRSIKKYIVSWDFFSFCGWEISHYNLNFHFSYFINKLEHLFMWLQVICSLFFWEFSVYLGSVSVKLLALFSSLLESSHFVRKSQNIHLSY